MLLLVMGCAARKSYNEGQEAVKLGQWETAVQRFSDAVEKAPKNPHYKIALERTRLEASHEFFKRGQEYVNTGLLEDAAIYFNKTIMFDPTNQYAIDELAKVMKQIEKQRLERAGLKTALEQMKDDAHIPQPPRLDPLSDAKISFYYKDTSIRTIYEQLGKVGGINIIFDKQIQDQDFSIDVTGVTFEDILNILSLANGHFIKVIDETTILVVPDNQAKRKEYEDQVIKTFYLSSADIKDVQSILSKTRTMAINPELNAITIMGTPKKVALASRIIESNDKSKSEVVVGIEILEVNRQRVQTLGIELTSYTVGQSLRGAEDGITVNDLRYLDSTDWILTLPSIVYNFLKTDSDTRFLARPQLRVAEGETAKIHIGDKVPIPTTTFNFTQTDQTGNVIPVTSYTYQNVGIQIEVTPRVHHNREVSLELKVEISNIGAVTPSGQPTIGNREITTVLRLKDGQTSLLAGLFKEVSTESNTGVPGISDIPWLKRILGKNTTDDREDDIILTITPHIVRIPNIVEEDLESIYLGMVDKAPFKARMTNLYDDDDEEDDEQETDKEEENTGGAAGTSEPGTSTSGAASDVETGVVEGWDEQDTDWAGESTPADDPFAGGAGGRGDDGSGGDGSGESRGEEDRDREGDQAEEPGGGDPPRGPVRISFVPGSVDTVSGSVFPLAVNIENAWNVAHAPFYITYDPQLVEYVGAAEGTFMNADGTSTTFQATAANGRVLVGLSRFGRGAGAEGAGTLATFQFRALAPGTGVLAFTNNSVKDPAMRNLPSIWTPAQLRVQ